MADADGLFCAAGPSVWNSLTDSLRNRLLARTILKTFLFATYWGTQRIKGLKTMRYTRCAPKKILFWEHITLQQLMIERRARRQKFQNFVYNKTHNLHVSALKYSLSNLHKSSIPPKLHKIWQWRTSFAQFHSKYSTGSSAIADKPRGAVLLSC